jgi:sugar-specific transcriptional regulator TrmB/DNA-binding CsgD family transcriptional regulator
MLLRLPDATADELAAKLGLPIVDVHNALRGLEAKGLVGRSPNAAHRFEAAPPEQALGPLVRRRHRELRTMRADVDVLRREYRGGGVGHRDALSSVDLVVGALALRARRDQLLASARAEVCAVIGTEIPALSDVPAWARVRLIVPRSVVMRSSERRVLATWLRANHEARVIARPPVSMLLIDRSAALLPVHSDNSVAGGAAHDVGNIIASGGVDGGAAVAGQAAVVIRPGGLHDTLLAMFESAWATAMPLVVTASGSVREDQSVSTPNAEDLHLLALMLDGLTDQAIAGRMSVGVRTVQRRVRDLIELAGVKTRLQLVWQAAQRGWI